MAFVSARGFFADASAPALTWGGAVFDAASGPTISSVTDTNKLIDEQALTITGTNLSGTSAVTVKQTGRANFDASSYITGTSATTVTLSGIDVQAMGMAYGAATISVTNGGVESADFSITIDKKTGQQYITLSGSVSGQGWALGEASADGDQLVAPTTTTQGGTFAFDGATGDYTISYGGSVPASDSAYWAWFDDSADQWYESTVQIANGSLASGGFIASIMRYRDRNHMRSR